MPISLHGVQAATLNTLYGWDHPRVGRLICLSKKRVSALATARDGTDVSSKANQSLLALVAQRTNLSRRRLLEQRLHRRSRANLLKITVDDAIAFRDPVEDRDQAAVAGTQGDQTLIRLVSRADNVDVFAKLT
jgi:hypothetical protein